MIQKPVGKVDGMAACLGKPLYVEDFIPRNALRLKIVQSSPGLLQSPAWCAY